MARPDRVRLVVLFGGRSAEHEVSCTTAAHVLAAADPERYELDAVGITRDGAWVRDDTPRAALAAGAAALPAPLRATGTAVEPLPTVAPSGDGLPVVVMPLLHGPQGEDGTVQGLLELAGVPTWDPGCWPRRCAWTRSRPRRCWRSTGCPRCPTWPSGTPTWPAPTTPWRTRASPTRCS